MQFVETLKLKGEKAFTGIVVAGFSAIMIGSIFLIISLLVINSVNTSVGAITGALNASQLAVLSSIGQALTVSGVALIVVGVAIIIAVLLGMVGRPAGRM